MDVQPVLKTQVRLSNNTLESKHVGRKSRTEDDIHDL